MIFITRSFICACIACFVFIHSAFAKDTTTVLFLGDSLTAGYGIAQENSYPNLAQKQLVKQGIDVRVINAGISGSTSASAQSRLRWYLQAKPDVLFLALGANDGLRGLPLDAMQDNLQATITLAQAQDMRVILAGMHVPPNYGAEYVEAFHGVFQRLGGRDDVVFIPFLLEGVAGVPRYNLADGIHPNEDGHKIVAQHILPALIDSLRSQ